MNTTTPNTATDYGTTAPRKNKAFRPLIAGNHALHFISTVIVMSIAAYFIANYAHNTHLVYWVSVGAVDTFITLAALALPFVKSYKGYLAPLHLAFSYLWLTAFIFAAQDYEYGSCELLSPLSFGKCSMKRTLEAFAFIAFFTNLVGAILEARLFDTHRVRGTSAVHHETKHIAVPATTGATHDNAVV